MNREMEINGMEMERQLAKRVILVCFASKVGIYKWK